MLLNELPRQMKWIITRSCQQTLLLRNVVTVNACLPLAVRESLDAAHRQAWSRPGSAAPASPCLRLPASGRAEGTVRFGLNGTEHEIDLTAEQGPVLQQGLACYVGAARRAGGSARHQPAVDAGRQAPGPASGARQTMMLHRYANGGRYLWAHLCTAVHNLPALELPAYAVTAITTQPFLSTPDSCGLLGSAAGRPKPPRPHGWSRLQPDEIGHHLHLQAEEFSPGLDHVVELAG